MNPVVEWLESPPGWNWARGHFSMEPTDCHDLIEIKNDYNKTNIADHTYASNQWALRFLIHDDPIWGDLTWTPDQPPDRV
jgi:hypothetical protein